MIDKWQPIETAPKDGTDVLLFVPCYRKKIWFGSYNVHVSIMNGVESRRHEGWSFGTIPALDNGLPTHWMPLPEPPEELKNQPSSTLRGSLTFVGKS